MTIFGIFSSKEGDNYLGHGHFLIALDLYYMMKYRILSKRQIQHDLFKAKLPFKKRKIVTPQTNNLTKVLLDTSQTTVLYYLRIIKTFVPFIRVFSSVYDLMICFHRKRSLSYMDHVTSSHTTLHPGHLTTFPYLSQI